MLAATLGTDGLVVLGAIVAVAGIVEIFFSRLRVALPARRLLRPAVMLPLFWVLVLVIGVRLFTPSDGLTAAQRPEALLLGAVLLVATLGLSVDATRAWLRHHREP